jgi:hypothetical protein
LHAIGLDVEVLRQYVAVQKHHAEIVVARNEQIAVDDERRGATLTWNDLSYEVCSAPVSPKILLSCHFVPRLSSILFVILSP